MFESIRPFCLDASFLPQNMYKYLRPAEKKSFLKELTDKIYRCYLKP